MSHISRRGLLVGIGAASVAGAAGFLGTKVLLSREQPAASPAPGSPAPAASPSPPASAAAPPSASTGPDPTAPPSPSEESPRPEPLAVPVIRRAGWGARDPQAPMEPHTPVKLTLHHTEVVLADDRDSPARIRQHQNYHMDDPGHDYPDLAYHFMVDRRGNVFEGRDLRYRGDTATEYDPSGHFLVCCEGDYNSQEPTKAQLRSVAALFAWASQEYGIRATRRTLRGHQDYAATSCPGESLERLIKDGSLAAQAAGLADSARVRLDYLSDARSKAAVAAIEKGRDA